MFSVVIIVEFLRQITVLSNYCVIYIYIYESYVNVTRVLNV